MIFIIVSNFLHSKRFYFSRYFSPHRRNRKSTKKITESGTRTANITTDTLKTDTTHQGTVTGGTAADSSEEAAGEVLEVSEAGTITEEDSGGEGIPTSITGDLTTLTISIMDRTSTKDQ